LPAFLRLLKGKTWAAILAHAALFGLWHVGPLVPGAPPAAVMAVMGVPFLTGLVWGWQVQRDKTVAWVIVFHTASLLVMSFFRWG
jgi:membrane protease YdiL (CAAX protease family)